MSQALFLGYCRVTNSIIPYTFDYYWQPPAAVYDPANAKKLLVEAGFANGFDAGPLYCDSSYSNMAEVSLDNLQQIGIRTQLQPIERAGFYAGYVDKKYTRGIIQGASGAFGNAATRLASFVVKGGAYAYGSYPDLTSSSRSRPANSTTRSAPRSSIRCSSSFTRRQSTRRSGSWASSMASVLEWVSRHSA